MTRRKSPLAGPENEDPEQLIKELFAWAERCALQSSASQILTSADLHEAIDYLLVHESSLSWDRKETVLAWKLSILKAAAEPALPWLGPNPELVTLPPLMTREGHHLCGIEEIPSTTTFVLLRALSYEMVFTTITGLAGDPWVHTAIDDLLSRTDVPDPTVPMGWKRLLQHYSVENWLGPRGVEREIGKIIEAVQLEGVEGVEGVKEDGDQEKLYDPQNLKRWCIIYKVDELSPRTQNCLWNAGIDYVDQLTKLTKSDLLGINNLGKKTLREIEAVLSTLGLSLKEDKPKVVMSPDKVSWKTKWGTLQLQSVLWGGGRFYYPQWHNDAHPKNRPTLHSIRRSQRKAPVQRAIQAWVDAAGGEQEDEVIANLRSEVAP